MKNFGKLKMRLLCFVWLLVWNKASTQEDEILAKNPMCADKLNKKVCGRIKQLHKCDFEPRLLDLCPETCGFCTLPELPQCAKSKFGCCWDKKTAKIDDVGSNCPECFNDFKTLCKRFIPDCESPLVAGRFMQMHCTKTCEMCDKGRCHDDVYKHHVCPFWKKLNLCETKPELMSHFCGQTCEFCIDDHALHKLTEKP